MTMIAEYKKDLSVLRKQREKHKKNESERKTVSNMISSTEYSLFWLEHGYERPPIDNSPTKLSKDKREELWGEIEHADSLVKGVYDTYIWEENENNRLTDEQLERMIDVELILKTLSNQELNAFILKNNTLLETSEIAQELGITERAVYNTLERVTGKIDSYFNNRMDINLLPSTGW